jgi:hypothetical protein
MERPRASVVPQLSILSRKPADLTRRSNVQTLTTRRDDHFAGARKRDDIGYGILYTGALLAQHSKPGRNPSQPTLSARASNVLAPHQSSLQKRPNATAFESSLSRGLQGHKSERGTKRMRVSEQLEPQESSMRPSPHPLPSSLRLQESITDVDWPRRTRHTDPYTRPPLPVPPDGIWEPDLHSARGFSYGGLRHQGAAEEETIFQQAVQQDATSISREAQTQVHINAGSLYRQSRELRLQATAQARLQTATDARVRAETRARAQAQARADAQIHRAFQQRMYGEQQITRPPTPSQGNRRNKIAYKCASEHCRDRGKIWPRLHNFKKHVRRMHKEEDEQDLIER